MHHAESKTESLVSICGGVRRAEYFLGKRRSLGAVPFLCPASQRFASAFCPASHSAFLYWLLPCKSSSVFVLAFCPASHSAFLHWFSVLQVIRCFCIGFLPCKSSSVFASAFCFVPIGFRNCSPQLVTLRRQPSVLHFDTNIFLPTIDNEVYIDYNVYTETAHWRKEWNHF